jgi:hypothetical protein
VFAEFLSGNHDGDGRFCDEVVGKGTEKDAGEHVLVRSIADCGAEAVYLPFQSASASRTKDDKGRPDEVNLIHNLLANEPGKSTHK